ncbi:phage portal protein [Cytobacillus purgationiresistens]|uniref:SPP1 family phage portal protein n=1 Tax=Cytobacillus purgationiresistens TaxID=863449 RepID=A0ABU0AFC6_9BACI|nr:phage portal protein [Cytobacillus purgationiresistens]MDQ0269950.1 SPP1 family phage portal protein [Cytobacillus purgationiresistens]
MLIEDLYRAPWHERMVKVIEGMVSSVITDNDMLAKEIQEWENSETRNNMITGELYYLNKTDILKKEQKIKWKSNQKLAHGFAKKLVDQKIGYLLSKEPTFGTENKVYSKIMQETFDRGLLKKIKNVGKEAINKGIAYLYPYINEKGDLSFMKFPSEQIIPFWGDNEHMKLISFIRVYEISIYMDGEKKKQKKVEYYHSGGIKFFVKENNRLIPDVPAGIEQNFHFTINDKPYVWENIPLIHFKYNEEEQPLIDSIKSLIDNFNLQASTNADLLADIPKFIYKLINFGGEDLSEFLSDLNKYMAVKLDENGDVDKLQAEIQTDAVEKEIDRNRNSIYEFGRGVDTREESLRDASGVALRFRYSDLDMDCNILEAEFQSSIEHMIWFINHYLFMTGKGDFTKEKINIIFNRDIIISETEAIDSCGKSVGILDDKTIRENHPWYTEEVEARLEEQKKEEIEGYQDTFGKDDVTVDE